MNKVDKEKYYKSISKIQSIELKKRHDRILMLECDIKSRKFSARVLIVVIVALVFTLTFKF